MNILLLGLIFIFSSEGLDINVVAKQEKIENKFVIEEEVNQEKSDEFVWIKSEIDFPSVECDNSMKLWINKTYNFKMCIPVDWASINIFKGNLEFITDESEILGNRPLDFKFTELNLSFGKNSYIKKNDDEEIKIGNKKILKHFFINNDGKKEFSGYSFEIKIGKNLYYGFGFDELTDEMKKIINSIKVLDKSKLKD